jgi:hypothetical protein
MHICRRVTTLTILTATWTALSLCHLAHAQQPKQDDQEGFVLAPGSTATHLLTLTRELPEGLHTKAVEVRVAKGGSTTWLLPVFLYKTISFSEGKPGQTIEVKITLWDCLKHAQLHAAITSALAHDAKIPVWTQAQLLTNSVEVRLYADIKGQRENLATATFLRQGGNPTPEIVFDLDPHKAAIVAELGMKRLGLEFVEEYLGRYVQDDLKATLHSSQEATVDIRNLLSKDASGREATVLVVFGGGIEQKQHVRQLFKQTTLMRFDQRQGAKLNPALLERFADRFFDNLLKSNEPRVLQEKEVVTFLLRNGMTVTGSIGEFRRLTKDSRKEMERRLADKKAWDDQDKHLRDYKIRARFSAGFGLTSGSASVDVHTEDEKKRSGLEEKERFEKDMASLAECIEGKLPVVALETGQMQSLTSQDVKELEAGIGTFRQGRKSLTHTLSFVAAGEKVAPVPKKTPEPESYKAAFADVDRRIKYVEKQVAEARARKAAIEAENRPHEGRIKSLKAKASKATTASALATAAAKLAQGTFNTQNAIISKLPVASEKMKGQLRAQVRDELKLWEVQAVATLRAEMVTLLEEEVKGHEADLQPARARLADADRAILALNQQLGSVQAEKAALVNLLKKRPRGS